jgi:hypothetical protein
MFNNEPMERAYINDGADPKHPLFPNPFFKLTQAHSVLIIFTFWVVRILFDRLTPYVEWLRKLQIRDD